MQQSLTYELRLEVWFMSKKLKKELDLPKSRTLN